MIKRIFIFISFITSLTVHGQGKTDDQQRDLAFYKATNKWFSAWQLVSKDIFKINKVKPVEFVFFDDKYVYSTSNVTIPNGIPVKGNDLMNLTLIWKKVLHNDSLTLPDRSVVPITLMSFAAEIPNEIDKSFFVMPLPGYWEKSGTTSSELGLGNLITGVFIHEFSHSQQMQNFGKQITYYEQQTNFGIEFSDDIVQNIFKTDSSFISLYNKEVEYFYAATKGKTLNRSLLEKGLQTMRRRQQDYFKGTFEPLGQIDDFFLTMEGLGQYAMYLWLTHPKGGNIKKDVAIAGVRRKKRWWSQDEGFALFLVLDKLTPPGKWGKDMFGNKTESVTVLIDKLYR